MPTKEEWDDAEDLVEEMLGPAARTPEQGIADMNRRIARYEALHAQVNAEPYTPMQSDRLLSIERQIAQWRRNREEYEAQLKGRN
jgi:hypothetical protein